MVSRVAPLSIAFQGSRSPPLHSLIVQLGAMSAKESSMVDSEKNDSTAANGVLDDERELARMGYKQELKCVYHCHRRLPSRILTKSGAG